MTNREKWMPKVIDDRIIEESICHKFVGSMTELGDCPKCPIKALCNRFVLDGGLTESEYKEAVSEWLDKEVEETDSTADTIFEKENALKLIDCLEATNDTLRRENNMLNALKSIGKETAND